MTPRLSLPWAIIFKSTTFAFFLAITTTPGTDALEETPLSISEAVSIALERKDPSVEMLRARAEGERQMAVAAGQLPDPVARAGIMNLPVDNLSLDREAMTQMQVGVRQAFPSGRKRSLAREQRELAGDALDAVARDREQQIVLTVRKMWLGVQSMEATRELVAEKQRFLEEMLLSMESRIETGRGSTSRLLTLQAELSLLQDRIEGLTQRIEAEREGLARFVGAAASRPLVAGNVGLPMPALDAESHLQDHPRIQADLARVRAGDKAVALAEQAYRPDFAFDLGYGRRGGGRSDMASAMVTFNVPLFTAKRQDRQLASSKQKRQAAQLARQTVLLDMTRRLRSNNAIWKRTGERIDLYNDVVLSRTAAASEASQNAFATGAGDFGEIIRTTLGELEARVMLEKVRLERAHSQAELLYLEGAGK